MKKNLSNENLSEIEFQHLWQYHQLPLKGHTLSGKTYEVLQTGKLNAGPGPDFLDAQIRIDNHVFYGSIELHLNPKDWYNHHHDTDERYNQVILHVFPKQALVSTFVTTNALGHSIEMIMTELPKTSIIQHFFSRRNQRPCKIQPISELAFLEQAKIASQAYLVQSTKPFFEASDVNFSLEKGFKQGAIVRLAQLLFNPYHLFESTECGQYLFQSLLKNDQPNLDDFIFIFNSVPHLQGSTFNQRIHELTQLSEQLWNLELPTTIISTQGIVQQIDKLINEIIKSKQRQKVLQRNWLIAGFYTWSSLIYDLSSMNWLQNEWNKRNSFVPKSIRDKIPFSIEKIEYSSYPNFAIDQFKTFCTKEQCLECKISQLGNTS